MVCWHVALLPGHSGGVSQIEMIGQAGVDVLVCGEVAEWETSEYARDAVHMGLAKALIVVGHANSEESGMLYLVDWLKPLLPGIPITHIPANDPFSWL
jgi:putative NIF3 family GTP cyclohydrolase 1 type 2